MYRQYLGEGRGKSCSKVMVFDSIDHKVARTHVFSTVTDTLYTYLRPGVFKEWPEPPQISDWGFENMMVVGMPYPHDT